MKAHLLHAELDFELEASLPPAHEALVEDLGLADLFAAMAAGDRYLHDVARTIVLAGLSEPEGIRYRQGVLQDCLAHPDIARSLYELAVAAIEGERLAWRIFSREPDLVLSMAVGSFERLLPPLRQLREIADGPGTACSSEGFGRFFSTLRTELDDAYLAELEAHARNLRFSDGVSMNARLGRLNTATDFTLLRPTKRGLRNLLRRDEPGSHTIVIPPRDDAGMQALGELRARGINLVANAASQAVDHVLGFFRMLRFELAFYLACLNLHQRLTTIGEPICFPEPHPAGSGVESAHGLVDIGLALRSGRSTVGSDLEASGSSLVLITGANQGGKSTFLRAVGIAQLMMQSGMFVGASRFAAEVRAPVLTHFKRREDAAMASGKLDEELKRFSEIVDQAGPHSLLLFNESFAATNEREGADIAEDIVRALLETGAKVLFVTHSYELARRFLDRKAGNAVFLRAERRADGRRTFRQVVGEPLRTSYGEDLYRRIFDSTP